MLIRHHAQSSQRSETVQSDAQTVAEEKSSRCRTYFKHLLHFFQAPVVVFAYSVVCYHICCSSVVKLFFWFVRPPGTVVPDGLLFYRRCFFLGSHISEAPRRIAAKLCHMNAIWLESPAKVGQVGGPPLKNFKNMQNFRQFFATSDFDRECLRNGLTYPNHNSKCI